MRLSLSSSAFLRAKCGEGSFVGSSLTASGRTKFSVSLLGMFSKCPYGILLFGLVPLRYERQGRQNKEVTIADGSIGRSTQVPAATRKSGNDRYRVREEGQRRGGHNVEAERER